MTTIKMEFNCVPKWKYADPIVPAINGLPKWYKDKKAYGEEQMPYERGHGTVKACPAMFDIMTLGYILPLWTDLYVEPSYDAEFGTVPNFTWGGLVAGGQDGKLLTQFNLETTRGMPGVDQTGVPAYKINSPWTLRTPKGYSTLHIAPLNNKNLLMEPISGIIHTDVYSHFINIPFIWTGPADFEGVIKRGTPLLQLIPFKREECELELGVITPEHQEEIDACIHYPAEQFGGGYRKLTNRLMGDE